MVCEYTLYVYKWHQSDASWYKWHQSDVSGCEAFSETCF